MKLKDLAKEDLEAMSYDDIAEMILSETGKQYKINELFKEVCKLVDLTEKDFVEKLPAFFDVLSTDHRFIMLENGLWDLKVKHKAKVVIDSDDEDDEEIEIEDEEETPEEEKDIYADDSDNDDDLSDDDDDLKDLVIIDEDEEASELN